MKLLWESRRANSVSQIEHEENVLGHEANGYVDNHPYEKEGLVSADHKLDYEGHVDERKQIGFQDHRNHEHE
jgi:hypothetical protein